MIKVLFAAGADRWAEYETPLKRAASDANLDVHFATEMDPADVEYIVYAPNSDLQDFRPYTNTKAVLNLWAGVEAIVGNRTLTQPLTRMVEPGLKEGMVEWVTGHVLRHHLGMDAHIVNPEHAWDVHYPPLARDRTVGILGLGELGAASAAALSALNFNVVGWSRSKKSIECVDTYAGEDGLRTCLAKSEILVLLLPATPATDNVINAEALAMLPTGAFVINPGRGPLIDDAALLAALDSGQVAHATLDVFRQEPLPKDHPYWVHPKVTVTPHVASETRASTAAQVVLENIRRGEAGEPFLHQVDRGAGY